MLAVFHILLVLNLDSLPVLFKVKGGSFDVVAKQILVKKNVKMLLD